MAQHEKMSPRGASVLAVLEVPGVPAFWCPGKGIIIIITVAYGSKVAQEGSSRKIALETEKQ